MGKHVEHQDLINKIRYGNKKFNELAENEKLDVACSIFMAAIEDLKEKNEKKS